MWRNDMRTKREIYIIKNYHHHHHHHDDEDEMFMIFVYSGKAVVKAQYVLNME